MLWKKVMMKMNSKIPNIDKYVYLDKKLEIKCVYLQKFNKWKPIEVIS